MPLMSMSSAWMSAGLKEGSLENSYQADRNEKNCGSSILIEG